MIVGTCGFVMTGSSAITDLLREYDSTWVFDEKEFTIVHNPDGIEDLDYQLNEHATKYTSSTVAFERFRRMVYFTLCWRRDDKKLKQELHNVTENFINSLEPIRWKGMGAIDKQLFSGRYYHNRIFNMPVYVIRQKMHAKGLCKIRDDSSWPLHQYEFAICPQDFIGKAQLFTHNLLKLYGADFNKIIVLDQPFAGNNPQRSFKYFSDECKAIIMDRDPRDWYLAAIYFRKHTNTGFQIPVGNVRDFVKFYKSLRNNPAFRGECKNVIKINLEELIYEYDTTVQKIEAFCDLGTNKRPKSIFDPKISIVNTQLIKRFPEYNADIKYIERELSDYLFPFEKYKYIDMSSKEKMFLNESPLNKK